MYKSVMQVVKHRKNKTESLSLGGIMGIWLLMEEPGKVIDVIIERILKGWVYLLAVICRVLCGSSMWRGTGTAMKAGI
jgi:hypothetical protein